MYRSTISFIIKHDTEWLDWHHLSRRWEQNSIEVSFPHLYWLLMCAVNRDAFRAKHNTVYWKLFVCATYRLCYSALSALLTKQTLQYNDMIQRIIANLLLYILKFHLIFQKKIQNICRTWPTSRLHLTVYLNKLGESVQHFHNKTAKLSVYVWKQ